MFCSLKGARIYGYLTNKSQITLDSHRAVYREKRKEKELYHVKKITCLQQFDDHKKNISALLTSYFVYYMF